jgi:hypothetical protein
VVDPEKYADAVKAVPPPNGVEPLSWLALLSILAKLAPVLIDLLRDPRVRDAIGELRSLSLAEARVGTPKEAKCEPPC